MNTITKLTLTATLLAATSALLPAQARERSATITGPQGQTATRQVERLEGDVDSSTTGPNGEVISRSVDRSAGSADAVLTGPRG
jgi:hypothetical protein